MEEVSKDMDPGANDPLKMTYFKDDPKRDEQSVRGCFLDEIYSRPNMEERLAEKFFDGDVPWMYDNLDNLPEQAYDEFFQEYLVEAPPRADRKYKIIFYGVSGYTGSLVMEYIKRECLDDFEVAFAGRTLRKVVAMRDKILGGTKWANADCLKCNMDNPFEVENLVANCCVVGNIAGPFMLTGGERLVEACIHYDTDYCDVSGEIPWSAKILQFHDLARDAGVYIVPSAAYAGGLPDIMAYMMAQKMREVDGGAEIKKLHGYVSMYQENEGTVQDGSREEDQDKVLTKVFRDPVVKSWVAPHVYAFFETRVVRRSNMLHNMLVGGPDMGFWYGPELNFTAEEERLRAEGKYYGAGEGPPLDELFEIGVYSLYHMVAISDSGKKLCWSIKGRDGYFETARMCVETALTMACSAPELRSGPCSVRGGMLGAGLAGKDILFDRLRKSGMGFIDWSPGTANDGNLPEDRADHKVWDMRPPPPKAEPENDAFGRPVPPTTANLIKAAERASRKRRESEAAKNGRRVLGATGAAGNAGAPGGTNDAMYLTTGLSSAAARRPRAGRRPYVPPEPPAASPTLRITADPAFEAETTAAAVEAEGREAAKRVPPKTSDSQKSVRFDGGPTEEVKHFMKNPAMRKIHDRAFGHEWQGDLASPLDEAKRDGGDHSVKHFMSDKEKRKLHDRAFGKEWDGDVVNPLDAAREAGGDHSVSHFMHDDAKRKLHDRAFGKAWQDPDAKPEWIAADGADHSVKHFMDDKEKRRIHDRAFGHEFWATRAPRRRWTTSTATPRTSVKHFMSDKEKRRLHDRAFGRSRRGPAAVAGAREGARVPVAKPPAAAPRAPSPAPPEPKPRAPKARGDPVFQRPGRAVIEAPDPEKMRRELHDAAFPPKPEPAALDCDEGVTKEVEHFMHDSARRKMHDRAFGHEWQGDLVNPLDAARADAGDHSVGHFMQNEAKRKLHDRAFGKSWQDPDEDKPQAHGDTSIEHYMTDESKRKLHDRAFGKAWQGDDAASPLAHVDGADTSIEHFMQDKEKRRLHDRAFGHEFQG
ncbi:oxidoreductase [Aureococcus anophagefferens]|nr:oxidoreductase [Aureococcus anophagefferens]